jgi:DDE family transposase
MARNGVRKEVRRRLYGFARRVASLVSDSRRQRFLEEMITGLVIGGHVHLSKIARAAGRGDEDIHAAEKRLSRHLNSEHWSMQPVLDELRSWSAASVQKQTLIVADLTDISKYYARVMEGLGKVRDASDPDKRLAPGYMLFEAYVRVDKWQLAPLVMEPLKTYAGGPTSENDEILQHIFAIHAATSGQGTWVLDRGADRRELMVPMLKREVGFIIRQRGDRNILTEGGRTLSVEALAQEIYHKNRPRRWSQQGWTQTVTVHLPEAPEQELLLVLHWKRADLPPLMLLVSPAARLTGRTGAWFVKAYHRRWGVEDATWGIKQRFHLELFLVRSWRSIRRLMGLVAIAFYWLNLWGQERFRPLREALYNHCWRLPKEVTYLFDWLATQIHLMLHPKPKIAFPPEDYSG